MAGWLQINETNLLRVGLLVTGGVTAVASYKCIRHALKAKTEQVYESQKSRDEYLMLHYGAPKEALLWDFGPTKHVDFPKRCAELCSRMSQANKTPHSTALDIGCAVGRSTFELSRTFDSVIGIDYSESFIKTCLYLKTHGSMTYQMQLEGELKEHHVAQVDPAIDRSRNHFQVGDACNVPEDLNQFGCVLAANLICRLPNPRKFLIRCRKLVCSGGILVITSPYTFMQEWTPKEEMIGGYRVGPNEVTGFDGLKKILSVDFDLIHQEDMPFIIRETRRKHQWTVAHATVWKRK